MEEVKHHRHIKQYKDRMRFRRSLNEKRKLDHEERDLLPSTVRVPKYERSAEEDIDEGLEDYYNSLEQ